MIKITITMDEKLVLWVRTRAAQRGVSLSRFVGELLREKMLEEEACQAARQQYLSQPPRELKKPGRQIPQTAGTA